MTHPMGLLYAALFATGDGTVLTIVRPTIWWNGSAAFAIALSLTATFVWLTLRKHRQFQIKK